MIEIYTDGACPGNPGYAGAAYVVTQSGEVIREFSVPIGKATNNQAELAAMFAALSWAQSYGKLDAIHVYTDSAYVERGYNNWCMKWEKNGFNIENSDYWREIVGLKRRLPNVSVKWVKARSGNKMNILADKLARIAAKSQKVLGE